MVSQSSFLVLWVASSVEATHKLRVGTSLSLSSRSRSMRVRNHFDAFAVPRGGETSQTSKMSTPKKKRKKKKKAGVGTKRTTDLDKKVIREAMREKDAATALGDAIRARAEMLKADSDDPLLQQVDQSVSSVGYAMGSSDTTEREQLPAPEEDGGGVEAAPTSVLANYFLKSHGGAHAVQCVCSLLAVLGATGSLLLPSSRVQLRIMFIRRTMLFAMAKHMSGLLAASSIAATAVPEVGLRQARKWVEKLARDPVSQYVFYAALLLLWLPTEEIKTDMAVPWWYAAPLTGKLAPIALVGPVLFREAVSTVFVVSDILVLLSTSAGQENTPRILQLSTSIVNAVMSVLVTPKAWRNADSHSRQSMLATLTSRLSLTLEIYVGLLLVVDGLMALWEFSFQTADARPTSFSVVKRLLCARLYVNFLWVRRRKITKLAGTLLRGGASQLPFRVIDVMMDPKAAMGIKSPVEKGETTKPVTDKNRLSWKDYAALGFTES